MHSTFIVNVIIFFWQQIFKKIKFLPVFILRLGGLGVSGTGTGGVLVLLTGKHTVNQSVRHRHRLLNKSTAQLFW